MTTCCRQPTLPAPARLGFDRGWLYLQPSFLNFGLPALLIDYRLIHEGDLQLEPFAQHDPVTPWREANACLRCFSGGLGLWQLRPEQLVAAEFQASAAVAGIAQHNRIMLLIGDTYDVQLSWSALWACRIGACDVEGW